MTKKQFPKSTKPKGFTFLYQLVFLYRAQIFYIYILIGINIIEMSKAKRTKRYIVEKTASIFNKRGFIGTSLSELTNATGLTKGSIYGNFANKEEVAIAVFNYNYQSLIKRFAIKLNEVKTAKDKLHAFLDTYEEVFSELMESGGCPILNNAVDADDTNGILSNLSSKAFSDWNKNLETIINNGKYNKEIDAQYYADLFIITIEGGLLLAKSTGKKQYFDHALDHLRMIINDTF